MTEFEEAYAKRIPPCCSYRTLRDHMDGLGLCWSLVTAVEKNRPMECKGCDVAIPGVRTLNWALDARSQSETGADGGK